MGQLRVMSSKGDKMVSWDLARAEAGDPEALAAIREAERIFAEERAKGAVAFAVEPGKRSRRVNVLERDIETVIVPRIVGG